MRMDFVLKGASHKYNCNVEIDFSKALRNTVFTGDEEMKPHIVGEVLEIFE
jgi:hypothetical protein